MSYWTDDESVRCEAHYRAQSPRRDERKDRRMDWPGARYRSPGMQYFRPEIFTWPAGAVVADCGAYRADTLLDFVCAMDGQHGMAEVNCPGWFPGFSRWYAFEPSRDTCEKLKLTVRAHDIRNVVMVQAATGAAPGMMRLLWEGQMGAKRWYPGETPPSDYEVPIVTLDDFPLELPPTFIKMDIEGMELEALQGGAETIRKARPVLAISVYHKPEDIDVLPEYIMSLCPDYKLFLRTHHGDGQDTVCYAVPPERIVEGLK